MVVVPADSLLRIVRSVHMLKWNHVQQQPASPATQKRIEAAELPRWYLQQLGGRRPVFRVLHQTLADKVLEGRRPQIGIPEGRRRVGGNHEDGLEERHC